jgi:osmotically inducible protein OsmC
LPRIERTAEAIWEGRVASGSGTISGRSSSAFELRYSEPTRVGDPAGETSPEELIAAAHASCFSMALSHGLAQAGTPPDRLEVKATSTFVPGTGITAMKLDVTGRVQGMDEPAFQAAAREAAENCPVSQALKGNVDISVDAHLS